MPTSSPSRPQSQTRVDGRLIGIVCTFALMVAAYAGRDFWVPSLNHAVAYLKNESVDQPAGNDHSDHADHSGHAGHDDHADHSDHDAPANHADHDQSAADSNPDSIRLTKSAWKNIGLTTGVLTTSDYDRTVGVPAIVVERPGRSLVQISAPVTGAVESVDIVPQAAVRPDQRLFRLRMTHEDVVTAQTTFLEHLHHQSTAKDKLDRLEAIGSDIIAGKRIIEQQYVFEEESERVQGLRQNLMMHGLSQQQVAQIEDSRRLLRTVTITAPDFVDAGQRSHDFYHVREIQVSRGEVVQAGDALALLADHSILYVQGQAFEGDAPAIFNAAATGMKLSVLPQVAKTKDRPKIQLAIESVSDQVDTDSRAFSFYLSLPNEPILSSGDDRRFIGWKFRPGQRMEVLIPTGETFENQFVLPADAVVIDGPNAFVFEQNGDYFDRVDVSVLYRDKDTVVVQRDGRLVGAVIAMTAAFEMHLALKNAAGGPVDPHAGHTH